MLFTVRRIVTAFFMCLGMFTAIPCPWRPWDEDARAIMPLCLPAVGAVIGLLWAALGAAGLRLLPAVAAALIAALPWLLTGFIHLDGFMDTCDALLSWRSREERLRILKDSRVGAFAVVGLGVLMLFSYDAARSITEPDRLRALVLIPILSRCCSAYCVLSLRPLEHSSYAALPRRGLYRAIAAGMWIAAAACWLLLAPSRWPVPLALALAYGAATAWAFRALGGISGDTAGFALTISECAALIALASQ